ncbi:Nodulin-like, putative [Leishmania lindenbergi]|uniref:Major Facilitator Superfamily/Nodulin-like n=1 Tax=Leishmania lindenbergi TaxID=651832 RepID=A0AAW3AU66_9TRYP
MSSARMRVSARSRPLHNPFPSRSRRRTTCKLASPPPRFFRFGSVHRWRAAPLSFLSLLRLLPPPFQSLSAPSAWVSSLHQVTASLAVTVGLDPSLPFPPLRARVPAPHLRTPPCVIAVVAGLTLWCCPPRTLAPAGDMQTNEKVEIIRLATGPQKPINEYRRFAILVLGSFGCIVCSFSYAWNLISGTMQQRYDLTQRDLSTVVTVGLVVQYCVLPYAFLYDYLGPLPISILSTVYFALGTLLLALCFMDKVEGSVVRLCVFNAMMATGCALFDLTSCITVLSHFPTNRGPVTALLKTFTGLGSAIVACLYTGYFDSNAEKHFFFLFSMGIVVGILCIAFIRLPPYHLTQYEERRLPDEVKERRLATKAQYLRQEAPLRRFVLGFIILVVLIIFVPTQSALVSYLKLGKAPKVAFAIVTTVLTLLYLLVAAPLPFLNSSHIPIFNRAYSKRGDADSRDSTEPLGLEEAQIRKYHAPGEGQQGGNNVKGLPYDAAAVAETLGDERGAVASAELETEIDYLAPQYQGSFIHNLTTLEIWALWWTMFTVVGAEFVIIFNARFILVALQSAPVSESLSTMLTVLNGVGSAVGRLMMSFFEVWSQKRKAEDRVPITIALFVPTSSIIISIMLFLVLPAAALPLPYIVAALGNGFLAGVAILVTRTIFAKDPAKHYHFCFTASMLASLVFNRFLYGEWYTVQADKQARADKMCYGKKCVMMPMLVLLGLACSAFITDVILHLRYRSYCQKALSERARLREEGKWFPDC